MENRIYLKDLPCYTQVECSETENSKLYKKRNRCFHLDALPTEGLVKEMREFVEYRGNGNTIKATSLVSEIWKFHRICDFLSEMYEDINSLLDVQEEQLIKNMKKWLLKHGYNVTSKCFKKQLGKECYKENEILSYLRTVIAFIKSDNDGNELETDIWNVDDLSFDIRKNPIKGDKSINFSKIKQEVLKQEMKKIVFMRLKNKAFGTIQGELVAINRFSAYLAENQKTVQSFADLNRDIIEKYLLYLNTEANERKSYATDLSSLKTIVEMAGRMLEKPDIYNLFLLTDLPRRPVKQFRAYSDNELLRINRAIVELDPQIARVLIIHQLLGTRISDTLTLLQDCISVVNQKYVITISQIKNRKQYKKTVNEDVVALINAAIVYTKQIHRDSKYVFASASNPDKPISYSTIQYHMMTMIQEYQLTDDQGKLFGCWTHMFRSTYGRKLTEMHVDDVTIAKLLGHSNTSSVKYYRKMGDMVLASETREIRHAMDEIIQNLSKGW